MIPTPVQAETAGAGTLLDAAGLARAARFMTPAGDTLDWDTIAAAARPDASLQDLRGVLDGVGAALVKRFLAGDSAASLIRARARLVDLLVESAWARTAADRLPGAALVAVGGYGRGELHPFSDVDLLVLLESNGAAAAEPVAALLALLWDLGLEVGHSVRTVEQCVEECRRDVTVTTTLMESRRVAGSEALLDRMRTATGPDRVWPSRDFLRAKLEEQENRHARYHDTAYNLEPNVKGSPGGLRDIQMLLWLTQREYGTGAIDELGRRGLLTPAQLRLLVQGREFLWRIRFALHVMNGRREDRLLFDHQSRLAALFGYRDASYMLAVEQLMQRYYRTVMELSRLNEMVLQLFQESILLDPAALPEPVGEHFYLRNGFLHCTDPEVFEQQPAALLEMFLLLQRRPEVRGVGARTITAIRRSLYLIDDEFRQDPRHHALFLELLRSPEGVTHELRRMNRYGVLGRYIPSFGRVVGRMQYDLFHAYTVDAHTLFVVGNLRRFAQARFDHEFPRCSEIMQGLPVHEIAYLAGLFHDIAKGRGGDHSELGAVDAEAFCLEHGMSRYDARLVAWLVRHHLLLSLTAQKKDISDPDVIREFAETVGDELHLDYLYVLTVADVRATNPKLWNSWRAQLFEELYGLAKQALRRGLENPIDKDELIDARRADARTALRAGGLDDATVDAVWAGFSEEYFLRCNPAEIVAHTQLLADPALREHPVLVDIREQPRGGGTAIFLFTPQRSFTFAIATAVLDELGLNIADARIIALPDARSLSTFVVLETDGEPISEATRLAQIRRRLGQALTDGGERMPKVTRRAPRQVRLFPTRTLVSFTADARNGRTVMELVAGDRPGLLCEVGKVLRDRRIAIQTAKIVTVGERAEDVFYVTDREGHPLSAAVCRELELALVEALSHDAAKPALTLEQA